MSATKQRKPTSQDQVEIEFLQGLRRRCPRNTRVLEALGDLYTRTGRFTDGLAVDEALARRCPDDPSVRYNLACSLCLTGRRDDAIEALTRAVDLGYADADWLERDGDLETLRGDPRFEELVRRLKRRA